MFGPERRKVFRKRVECMRRLNGAVIKVKSQKLALFGIRLPLLLRE